MKILVTGSANGIGKRVSERFLALGHEVYGLDLCPSSIIHPSYHHYKCDVRNVSSLPDIDRINIIFVNAGTQNGDDISTNLQGSINTVEKYGFHKDIKSILFNASSSARSGFEFPNYVASKAGIVGYMKNVACRVAQFGATCNSLSLGGVITSSNEPVINNKQLWQEIMKKTPLKKWMSEDEVADFVIFLTLTNKSMSGQDILVDNGELNLNNTFVWPK